MWIVPKNLNTYHSVQVMGESTSDLKKLSEMSEQSLMWRSKPSQSSTWLLRWSKGLLNQHLSGRILKPSTGKSFVEKWISCQEASLVSPLVQQEEEKQTQTQDTSSHISSEESKYLNLPLFSLRMSKESSQQNSNQMTGQTQKEHRFCSMFLENWRGWVTKQRLDYSQRERSVLHIGEKESLYLVLREVSKVKASNGSMDSLSEIEKTQVLHTQQLEVESNTSMSHHELSQGNWATPMAGTKNHMGSSVGYYLRRMEKGKQITLDGQVMLENWATPQARDWKEADLKRQLPKRKNGGERLETVPRQVHHQANYKGKLNPRWVEMLMGLPIGWTQPSCSSPLIIEQTNSECLETELFQILQEEPLSTYGENWSTPPASQRGEDLRNYISRMRNRISKGKETFAPTLQVQVEAEEKNVDIEELIWATPNTMDSMPLRSDEALRKQATTVRKGRSSPANLREQVDENSCEIYKEEKLKLDEKGQVSLF